MALLNRRPKRTLDIAREELHPNDIRRLTLTVKISPNELDELQKRADEHAEGKRAEYIRAALMTYRPKKADFT